MCLNINWIFITVIYLVIFVFSKVLLITLKYLLIMKFWYLKKSTFFHSCSSMNSRHSIFVNGSNSIIGHVCWFMSFSKSCFVYFNFRCLTGGTQQPTYPWDSSFKSLLEVLFNAFFAELENITVSVRENARNARFLDNNLNKFLRRWYIAVQMSVFLSLTDIPIETI